MMETPTIAQAAALIAARAISPVELVEHCLSRIDALDGALHSFITVTPERALEDARAAERRMMAGTLRGKLDGIPIAHKDIYRTQGIATTAHSRLLQGSIPDEDADTVMLLARSGTSLLGKLATHEFALGGPSFDLPWPPARNPWNVDHFTSGSSSGSAVAVAAGFVLGATGSDTGGSIREPAALCGIAGVKPTYGLCSRRGVLPLAYSLDHPGPMAWTIEDCALLLQGMASGDEANCTKAEHALTAFDTSLDRGVKGLRIGVAPRWHEADCPVSPAVRRGFENALSVWHDQGAEVVEITMPSLFDYQAVCVVIMLCEAYAVHERLMRSRFYDYGESLRDRVLLGGLISASDYLQTLRRRSKLCAAMVEAAAGVEVIATPGASREAARIDDVSKWGFLASTGFAKPFNVTGWPAACVCAGFGDDGLPVSIQIAARPFQEALMLQVANAFEKATDFRSRRPV